MSQLPAFWDLSALVPLCVQESNSAHARKLAQQFSPVVWWASRVEVYNAFARLSRSGDLNARTKREAIERLQSLIGRWTEIAPGDIVRDQAQAILDAYPLRAADSLQLAAALVWCRDRPKGRTFISALGRLCEAAEQTGFTVLRP